MPVIQSFVNPTRDTRRSSHSKKHSSQKKSHSSVSRTPVVSDYSVEDAMSSVSNSRPFTVKSEIPRASSAASMRSCSPSDYLSIKSEPCTPRSKYDDGMDDMLDFSTGGNVIQISSFSSCS